MKYITRANVWGSSKKIFWMREASADNGHGISLNDNPCSPVRSSFIGSPDLVDATAKEVSKSDTLGRRAPADPYRLIA